MVGAEVMPMAAFVLVPGAWMGGWIWQDVARRLRQAGHDAYPVTLTGLGERAHLARPDVNLDTHIQDVLGLLRYEELEDVVLVGHSYAGLVVEGVADRAPERLSHLVYVDTGPMANGESMMDFYAPEEAAHVRDVVVPQQGEGWKLPYPGFTKLGPPPVLAGLGHREHAHMDALATPQPFGTYSQPLRLEGRQGTYQPVLIACNAFRFLETSIPKLASFLTPRWRRYELETGHWPMLSAPEELTAQLLKAHHP
jgi:pimeloyl-ACP methyl ester carboxylesterase